MLELTDRSQSHISDNQGVTTMKKSILFAIVFIAVASTSSAAKPDNAVGPIKPVEVVNETITVEGNVNATLEEPVEVSGEVNATIDRPIQITQSEPDRFQISWNVDISDSLDFARRDISIPPSKRLIITHISAEVVTNDDKIGVIELLLGPSNELGGDPSLTFATYSFPMQDSGGPRFGRAGERSWLLSQEVELWADSFASVIIGRGVSAGSPRIPRGEVEATVSISGRLVDIPVP